jgi:hypothetical protein
MPEWTRTNDVLLLSIRHPQSSCPLVCVWIKIKKNIKRSSRSREGYEKVEVVVLLHFNTHKKLWKELRFFTRLVFCFFSIWTAPALQIWKWRWLITSRVFDLIFTCLGGWIYQTNKHIIIIIIFIFMLLYLFCCCFRRSSSAVDVLLRPHPVSVPHAESRNGPDDVLVSFILFYSFLGI